MGTQKHTGLSCLLRSRLRSRAALCFAALLLACAGRGLLCNVRTLRRAENLCHRFALREFIDELIEISCLLREWIRYLLNAVAADGASDELSVWVELCASKEGFKSRVAFDVGLESFLCIAREPRDDFMQFVFGAALLLDFREVVGVDTCKLHGCDALIMIRGGGSLAAHDAAHVSTCRAVRGDVLCAIMLAACSRRPSHQSSQTVRR